MAERADGGDGDVRTAEETLSRTELKIEQEKLKLERERILLERDRLEAMRDRAKIEDGLHINQYGKQAVTLSTMTLISIICLLMGGILGAFSSSLQRDRRNSVRLHEVMQSLATASSEGGGSVTNGSVLGSSEMPAWLKTMKPKDAHAGISLVVIQ